MSSTVPEVKPCKTHGMYGECPGHPGPYDTPEPELNVEAKTRTLSYECGHCGLYHYLPVDTATAILALIQQVSDQRVREFAEKLQEKKHYTGDPVYDPHRHHVRPYIKLSDLDQTLADYLSHKEQR